MIVREWFDGLGVVCLFGEWLFVSYQVPDLMLSKGGSPQDNCEDIDPGLATSEGKS